MHSQDSQVSHRRQQSLRGHAALPAEHPWSFTQPESPAGRRSQHQQQLKRWLLRRLVIITVVSTATATKPANFSVRVGRLHSVDADGALGGRRTHENGPVARE